MKFFIGFMILPVLALFVVFIFWPIFFSMHFKNKNEKLSMGFALFWFLWICIVLGLMTQSCDHMREW